MKKRRKNKETKTTKEKIYLWIKNPENILFCLIILAGTIIGIIDNNLEIIFIVYFLAFLYGLVWRLIFYIKDKIFSRKN
jgi:ABC-type transport system involved in cytochrome bd biosynthesis fused ATPase/permease subunit